MTPEELKWLEEGRSRLYIHGFLTESENKKVRDRIKKECDKSGLMAIELNIFNAED